MTKEEFEQLPREKRWSFSRLSSFISCPRKHYYSYIEELKGMGNIHLTLGDYWHKLMEAYNKEEDYEQILQEYEREAKNGNIGSDPDLLRHVFNEYISWYPKDNVLYSEDSLIEEWENGDHAIFKIDCIYEKDGLNILRDYKTTTNKLKYGFSDVKYNQQLLLYKAVAEEYYGIKIHGIEIDEIRLEKLQPVPYNKSGKPSADIRKLGLVKYETYREALEEMGIEDEPEFQNVLTELEKRGHPLFNRVTVDLSDENVVYDNLEDLYGIYKLAKTGIKSRHRNALCNYCDLKELCEADYSNLDEEGRKILIEKITKST